MKFKEKFKEWLKLKLRKFLEVDKDYSEFLSLQKKYEWHKDSCEHSFQALSKGIYINETKIDAIHRTLESIVHVGTDVRPYDGGHSWAVVCIEGNINIVKFVPLDRKYAREILDFLKHFEAGRHCIDTPSREMFHDMFVFDNKNKRG